jgi:hypothetical protein
MSAVREFVSACWCHSVPAVAAAVQVTGYATTYAVTAASSRPGQLAAYISAAVPRINDFQCANLVVFCKYSRERDMPVLTMHAEGVAPPSPLSATVPLGWLAKQRVRCLVVQMLFCNCCVSGQCTGIAGGGTFTEHICHVTRAAAAVDQIASSCFVVRCTQPRHDLICSIKHHCGATNHMQHTYQRCCSS